MLPRRRALFSLVALVLVLAIAEAVLRIGARGVGLATIPEEQVRSHIQQDAMQYHPYLGWVRRDLPNPALGINAQGFRHPDVPQEKAPATWRAFALGDSQTYGAGVDAADAWPSQAEALLRQGRSSSIELINAGISGYTSLQALRLIRSRLLDWQPDALVVDCRTHDSPRDDVFSPGGSRTLDLLTFHSRLVWSVRFLVERLRPVHARPMRAEALQDDAATLAARFGNHDLIVALARQHGVQVLFVDYPFWSGDGIACLAPAAELPAGVPVVPACAALRDSGLPPDQLFLDNNHLTVEGNRIVGRAVAETIRALAWLLEPAGEPG